MAQKRPPLPIFNKNKRPRQALVAHPNNAPGTAGHSLQQRKYQQSCRQPSTTATSYAQPHPSHNRSSYYQPHTAGTGQENRTPTASPYTHSYNTPVSQPANYRQRESTYHYGAPGSSFPAPQPGPSMNPQKQYILSQFVRQHTNETTQLQLTTGPGSMASVATATGTAKEPTRNMAAQRSTNMGRQSLNSKHMKPSLRILTATAQGMKHWSQYKKHCPLLFEVFGRLSSPTTLVRGQTRCKQFQLSTVDGPVRCIYWEMGECLPPLLQGRTLRVVGQWDGADEVMQCYSVREAVSREEEMAARKAIDASDKSMREFVAQLNPSQLR